MKVEIHGEQYALADIFGGKFAFRMPRYQRPYSWEEQHAEELLDDLLQVVLHRTGDVKDLPPYFLGTIVLVKERDDPASEVVDGQQRLTTITLLMSALRAVLPQDASDEVTPFLYEKGSQIKGTTTHYRVMLRKVDNDFFVKRILEPGAINQIRKLNLGDLPDSQDRLCRNAKLYLKRLETLGEEGCRCLAGYLAQRCYLVAVSTPDLESAWRIFSVLNERGMNLTHADILKSEILGSMKEPVQSKYADLWEHAERDLGQDDFADLFGHVRMIYRKTKPEGSVLSEFREHVIRLVPEGKLLMDEVILPYAQAYGEVLKADFEAASSAGEVNRSLRWLGRVENRDWVPSALRAIKELRDQPDKLAWFLANLEALAAYMMLARENVNTRIARYRSVLTALELGHGLETPSAGLLLTDDEATHALQKLREPLYNPRSSSNPVCSYVLWRANDELADDGGGTYEPRPTIEHVLPQR